MGKISVLFGLLTFVSSMEQIFAAPYKTNAEYKAQVIITTGKATLPVPDGSVVEVAQFDPTKPTQTVEFSSMKFELPTDILDAQADPNPWASQEVLSEPNEEGEIVCTDMGALKNFFDTTGKDSVGIIYCVNRQAMFKATFEVAANFDIPSAVMANSNVSRATLVMVLHKEIMEPKSDQKPSFFQNGRTVGTDLGVTPFSSIKIPPDKTVVLFSSNPTNGIAYLANTGVRHVLLVSSFADPFDPSITESLEAIFQGRSMTLSVLSTPVARVSGSLKSPTTPIMFSAFKPAKPICAIIKRTKGVIYLNKTATERQVDKVKETYIPSTPGR